MKRTKQINMRLTEDEHTRWKRAAEYAGCPITTLILIAMGVYLGDEEDFKNFLNGKIVDVPSTMVTIDA